MLCSTRNDANRNSECVTSSDLSTLINDDTFDGLNFAADAVDPSAAEFRRRRQLEACRRRRKKLARRRASRNLWTPPPYFSRRAAALVKNRVGVNL